MCINIYKISIWLTVIVQRCRVETVSFSLTVSFPSVQEWAPSQTVRCSLSTYNWDRQAVVTIRYHGARVSVSCYWVFLYLCSLSLDLTTTLTRAYHLPLLSLPCSTFSPPKFLCLFPSQIAMYYSSVVCRPFPASHYLLLYVSSVPMCSTCHSVCLQHSIQFLLFPEFSLDLPSSY